MAAETQMKTAFLLISQWPLHSPHLEVLLLIETGAGLWERSTLQEWFCKAGENFIEIPAKENDTHQHAKTYFYFYLHIFAINKQGRKENDHQVKSDLLKSSKQWKATMAPMRWQGGDKAPSRKSSLPCRLILNWPDPFIGTGTLKNRDTHRLWQQDRTTQWSHRKLFFSKNTEEPRVQWYREQLKQVWMFSCIYILITYSW